MRWLILSVVALVAWPVCSWLLVALARRYGTDPTPMGRAVPKFAGFDPALRDRSTVKRRHAEDLRQQLARTDSQPAQARPAGTVRRFGK